MRPMEWSEKWVEAKPSLTGAVADRAVADRAVSVVLVWVWVWVLVLVLVGVLVLVRVLVLVGVGVAAGRSIASRLRVPCSTLGGCSGG